MIKRERCSVDVLEVGADANLAHQLRQTIETKPGWALTNAADVTTAVAYLSKRNIGLAIVCVRDDLSKDAALSFLAAVDATRVPTVVIYDQLNAPHILNLFQQGAAECLARPLNLTRLSLVLDLLAAPALARNRAADKSERDAGRTKPKYAKRKHDTVRRSPNPISMTTCSGSCRRSRRWIRRC